MSHSGTYHKFNSATGSGSLLLVASSNHNHGYSARFRQSGTSYPLLKQITSPIPLENTQRGALHNMGVGS